FANSGRSGRSRRSLCRPFHDGALWWSVDDPELLFASAAEALRQMDHAAQCLFQHRMRRAPVALDDVEGRARFRSDLGLLALAMLEPAEYLVAGVHVAVFPGVDRLGLGLAERDQPLATVGDTQGDVAIDLGDIVGAERQTCLERYAVVEID